MSCVCEARKPNNSSVGDQLRELGSPEDAGVRLNATRFSCGTIRDMSDGFVRRQRRPATATCGPCNLSPPGRRTVRGEFRPPLVVYPYPLPLCCLSGSHSNDRSDLVRFNLH